MHGILLYRDRVMQEKTFMWKDFQNQFTLSDSEHMRNILARSRIDHIDNDGDYNGDNEGKPESSLLVAVNQDISPDDQCPWAITHPANHTTVALYFYFVVVVRVTSIFSRHIHLSLEGSRL